MLFQKLSKGFQNLWKITYQGEEIQMRAIAKTKVSGTKRVLSGFALLTLGILATSLSPVLGFIALSGKCFCHYKKNKPVFARKVNTVAFEKIAKLPVKIQANDLQKDFTKDVFKFLDIKDLYACQSLNKHWKKVSLTPKLRLINVIQKISKKEAIKQEDLLNLLKPGDLATRLEVKKLFMKTHYEVIKNLIEGRGEESLLNNESVKYYFTENITLLYGKYKDTSDLQMTRKDYDEYFNCNVPDILKHKLKFVCTPQLIENPEEFIKEHKLESDKEIFLIRPIYAPDWLKGDKQFILTVGLAHASDELKDDREFVLASIKLRPNDLLSASPRLLDDEDVVLAAVELNHSVLACTNLISNRVLGIEKVALAAVKQDPSKLYWFSSKIKNNENFIRANPRTLNWASERVKKIIKADS